MPYKDPETKRAYQRDWIAARRAEWLADKACAVCGSTERLEVDHVDPDQKVDHKVWSWSQERRDAELAKCQVLCWPHHRAKTDAQIATRAPHGTRSRYKAGKCKCTPCRAANAAYRRERRAAADLALDVAADAKRVYTRLISPGCDPEPDTRSRP